MGYIYLICDAVNDAYKVGITKNKTDKRLRELKTGNANEIFVLEFYESDSYKDIERLFHRRYKYLRINGEWFSLTNEMVLNFIEICKQIEEDHLFLKNNNDFY